MNITEFTNLTGYTSTDEEYDEINQMYMDAGNMDKFQFCEDWKEHHDSKLLNMFHGMAQEKHQEIMHLKSERLLFADKLLDLTHNDYDFDKEHIWLLLHDFVGIKAVIQYKIENGMELIDEEKAYIRENLR